MNSIIIGLELLAFIAQTRAFCAELVRVLSKLPRYFNSIERQFAAELAREVETRLLAPDHIQGSRDVAVRGVLEIIEGAFGRLPPGDLARLQELIAAEHHDRVGDDFSDYVKGGEPPRFSAVPAFPSLLTEPGRRWRPFALTLESGRLLGPSEEQRRAASRWAEVIADLDRTTSLHVLLEKLAALREETFARVAFKRNPESLTT